MDNRILNKIMKTYHEIVLNPKCDRDLMNECRKLVLSSFIESYMNGDVSHETLLRIVDDIENTESDFRFIDKYGYKMYHDEKKFSKMFG